MYTFFLIFISFLTLPEIDFVYAPGTFIGDKGLELRVFLNIDVGKLTLIKEGEDFNTAYSISIILKKDNRERGNIWMKKIEGLAYGAKQTLYDTITIDILPGCYDMTIIISDLNSQKSMEKKSELLVDSLSSDFSISSFILGKYDNLITDNSVTSIDGISCYLEVYSDKEAMFYFTAEDYKDSISITPGMTPITMKPVINKLTNNFATLTAVIREDGKSFERVDTVFIGSTIFADDNLYKSKINALMYIFNTPKLDTLLLAKPEKRDSLWGAFWKFYDPTPETDRNELEDEYLARINYAENYLGGWQTDMGRVWLVMGMPDEIDRHPFELEVWAYEIWYYYSINEKFIFYDTHGVGWYELIYPENWNPWRSK